MTDPSYRYFLAFRPGPAFRRQLVKLCDLAGQQGRRISADNLHLTLCVIAEHDDRNDCIAGQADAALANGLPPSCVIRLGRVRGGARGAAVFTIGRQLEILLFYRQLIGLLAQQQIAPMYREAGLNPHVTLGYDRSSAKLFAPCEWVPGELVLIESEIGRGIHNVLRRWPLQPPLQGSLPFEAPLPLLPRRVA